MYISTGNNFQVISGFQGKFSIFHFPFSIPILGYLKKYQAESKKVSETSVSRRASPPHSGHLTLTKFGSCANGETPVPLGLKFLMYGSSTGRSFSGTGYQPAISILNFKFKILNFLASFVLNQDLPRSPHF